KKYPRLWTDTRLVLAGIATKSPSFFTIFLNDVNIDAVMGLRYVNNEKIPPVSAALIIFA
ncbi:MAG: hypothetical protein ACC707_21020, partial [Thiohalomonadales bacterium]